MESAAFDHDVAVIGYGPTGVIAANFLGRYGLRTLVVERERDIYSRARAVTVDGSTMRIFQMLGLDAAAKADMDVTTALRWKTYDGFEIMRSSPPGTLSASGHEASYMIFQPTMEATLRSGIDACASQVDVRFGEEFTVLAQDDVGVTVTTRRLDNGAESRHRVRYAIGADGGGSRVRRALGIAMDGQTRERNWIVIDARIKRWWPERDLLTFWADPVRPVVDIPLALDHHRWEIPLAAHERKEDFDSRDVVWTLLRPLGVTPDNVEIVGHAFYQHHLRQAQTWRSGRVLLAGDAAHLMPPWAGQGMQSGIRDALNLAWKLRAILRDGMADTLLDSYQPERQPHVTRVSQMSVQLGKLIETDRGFLQFMRNRVLPLLSRAPFIGERMRRARQIPPDLAAGFIGGTPAAGNPLGRLFPQPMIAGRQGHRCLLDTALGLDFAILGLDVDPDTVLSPQQTAAWDRLGARRLRVCSALAAPESERDVVDFQNVLGPWFAAYGARVVVLRPDRFVVASDSTGLDVPGV